MKKIIYSSIILCLLTSCGGNISNEQKADSKTEEHVVVLTDVQSKNAGIQTGKLETHTISSILKVKGKVDVPPQNMVSVSVPLGGYLKSSQLLSGMSISKGQVLATVEDPQYIQLQQDYLTAHAQYAYYANELRRQKELNASKSTSDKVYEQIMMSYQTQNILIKSLGQKLRLIGINPDRITPNSISRSVSIYSPISGFVSKVNVNVGKYINPSDVLFELVNSSNIHLVLNVFEQDVNKLKIGQKLFATTNDNSAIKHECKIVLINKSLSNENATEVHCQFVKYDKSLLPGMFMNAEIEITGKLTLALPDDAIVSYGNKQFAFVEKIRNSFEMVQIQTGESENGFTEIINAGNLSNKNIVKAGAYNLLMVLKNGN
jgi:cobalt-zinc-cadmium efflux system membrane fusion protein